MPPDQVCIVFINSKQLVRSLQRYLNSRFLSKKQAYSFFKHTANGLPFKVWWKGEYFDYFQVNRWLKCLWRICFCCLAFIKKLIPDPEAFLFSLVNKDNEPLKIKVKPSGLQYVLRGDLDLVLAMIFVYLIM
jgi:hypothetical protein